ncbi:cupin domain-containing protein [bacterium]|nr:cupin domain-containing protein [bacterium]MDC0362257.1 cupin domain-containing protein [Halioglobus sp.]
MTKKCVIVSPEERARPLKIAGFSITILASGEETEGYEIFHQVGPEGTGPGPHLHPWDESFFVLKGEVVCGVDDTETLARQGTLVHIPGNTTHWYRFGESGGEILSMTSYEGASHMYEDFDREGSWENPNRDHLVQLAAKHGQVVVDSHD